LSESLNSLFGSEEASRFADVLPVDERVHWKFVQANPGDSPAGVLVFISPDATALPQPDWHPLLRDSNLHWIAAENFGNDKPTARRVLAAIMGLRRLEREFELDRKRIYIGGMSGGGRAASTAITTFPHLFSGALYIVGADAFKRDALTQFPDIRANRYVFITGTRDFNRGEMRAIYRKYVESGAKNALLMDLRKFGHEYPNAEQLKRALDFLDGQTAR
jgi:predicted esterase